MPEYIVKVGADFTGVTRALKELDAQIAQTSGKANATRTALPQGLASSVASNVGPNKSNDVRVIAAQTARAIALGLQTAEVNARRTGNKAPDRTKVLETTRLDLVKQLGISGQQQSQFTRAWRAQIATVFDSAYEAILNADPKQQLSRFNRQIANPALQQLGVPGKATVIPAGQSQVGILAQPVVPSATSKSAQQRVAKATENNAVQIERSARAASQSAAAQEDITKLLRNLRAKVARGIITADEGNARLAQAGAIAPGERTVLNTIENQGAIPAARQSEAAIARLERQRQQAIASRDISTSPVLTGQESKYRVIKKLGDESINRQVQADLLANPDSDAAQRAQEQAYRARELERQRSQAAAARREREIEQSYAQYNKQFISPTQAADESATQIQRDRDRLDAASNREAAEFARARRLAELRRIKAIEAAAAAEEKAAIEAQKASDAAARDAVRRTRSSAIQGPRIEQVPIAGPTYTGTPEQYRLDKLRTASEERARQRAALQAANRQRPILGPNLSPQVEADRLRALNEQKQRDALRTAQQNREIRAAEAETLRVQSLDPSLVVAASNRNKAGVFTADSTTVGSPTIATVDAEKQVLAEQERQLGIMRTQTGSKTQQAAIDAQIATLQQEQAGLLTLRNALIKQGSQQTAAGQAAIGVQQATAAQAKATRQQLQLGSGGPKGPNGPGGGGPGNNIPPGSQPNNPINPNQSIRGRLNDLGGASSFFGGGALSTLKYALPAAVFYGAISGIKNTVKEAEELQYNLARLESQFNALGGAAGDNFGEIKQSILDVATETGLAADEITNLRLQLTGAFTNETIGGSTGKDLVDQQTLGAAKIAQVTKLPLKEVTDGLTAASLAFNASFEKIGDVALAIEQKSGVLSTETISFIGDIAPVAEEAGYSLEEFAALAAVAQQRSGRSGAALAESFGRVIPAITENKKALLDLASTESALGTPEFLDAIRNSDPKAILEQLGKAYTNADGKAKDLTASSKQLIVNLLGGRREAQALIPALANQDLTDQFEKAADSSAGTLETRFQKIRETLTNTLQRAGEAIRQLGVAILESGIADAFGSVVSGAAELFKVLSSIFSIVGKINDLFGGLPATVLLTVAAVKLMQKLLTVNDGLGGERILGANLLPGAPGFGSRTYNPAATGLFSQYRASRLPTFSAPAQQFPSGAPIQQVPLGLVSQTGGYQGVITNVPAGPVGIIPGAAGGPAISRIDALKQAASANSLYLGIAGLGAVYGLINGRIDADKAALDKLRQETEVGNQKALDIGTAAAREDRIKELVDQANESRAQLRGLSGQWDKFWNSLTGLQSDAEVLMASATALEIKPETRAFYDNLDTGLNKDLTKLALPKFGKPTGDFRSRLQKRTDNADKSLFQSILDIGTPNVREEDLQNLDFTDRENKYLDDVAKAVGVRRKKLDENVALALLEPSGNAIKQIRDAAEGKGQFEGKITTEGQRQAQRILDDAKNKGLSDAEFNAAYKTQAELKKTPKEENTQTTEQLQAALNAGSISFTEYIKARRKAADDLLANLNKGEVAPDPTEVSNALAQARAVDKEATDHILEVQSSAAKIREAFGATEDQQTLASLADNINNLRDGNFSDPQARVDAALAIIEAQKKFASNAAAQSGDVNEANRILNEGVAVLPEARAAIEAVNISRSTKWVELAASINKLRETDLEGLKGIVNPNEDPINALEQALTAGYTNNANVRNKIRQEALKAQRALKANRREFTPEEINALPDVSGDPGASAAQALAVKQGKELSDSDRKLINDRIESLVWMMKLSGSSSDEILTLLAGGKDISTLPAAAQAQIGARYNEIVGSIPEPTTEQTAALDALNKENLLKGREAELSYRRAAVGNNKFAMAKLDREAVNIARERASLAKDEDKAVAFWEAKEAEVVAQKSQLEATIGLQRAQYDYMRAVAESNGDLQGAANIDVASAVADRQAIVAQGGDPELLAGADAAIVSAQRAARDTFIADRKAQYDLFAAYQEFEGDTVGAATTNVKAAEEALSNAQGTQEIAQAQQALLSAQKALKDTVNEQREAQFALFSAIVAGDDPVAQAQVALRLAEVQAGEAKGVTEQAQAALRLVEAQRSLRDAMQEARYSQYTLRQAELQAMEDDVGAANVAAQLAQQQLADAISNNAGTAEINNLRAQVISTQKAAKDAAFDDQMEEYKWLLDMGQITKGQYINYLEGLKSTLTPGTKSFKDLELTIKQLRDDIGGDLQANLPTSLALPTLYEVRRLDPSGTAAGGTSGAAIGYQDNRVQDVKIYVTNGMGEQEVVQVLSDALGTGRNGYGNRRY